MPHICMGRLMRERCRTKSLLTHREHARENPIGRKKGKAAEANEKVTFSMITQI